MRYCKTAAKAVGLVMLGLFMVGCSSLTQSTEQVSIFQNNPPVPAPVLIDKNLLIENLRLSPWPLPAPNCKQCQTSVERIMAPDGASSIVTLAKNTQVIWMFIDSRRSFLKTPIGTLLLSEEAIALQSETSGNVSLKPGETVKIQGCQLTVLWRNEPYPKKIGISNENPSAHAQLLYDCL